MKKNHRELIKELQSIEGIENIELQQHRRHPKITGLANGRPFKIAIACTPKNADHAIHNSVQEVRRIMRAQSGKQLACTTLFCATVAPKT